MEKHDVPLSRLLSKILRHDAAKYKLDILPNGYVSVKHLLQLPAFKGKTFADIIKVVECNDKQRFKLIISSEPPLSIADSHGNRNYATLPHDTPLDHWWIRANQGHSIKNVSVDMQPLSLAEAETTECIHGTFLRNWPSICE